MTIETAQDYGKSPWTMLRIHPGAARLTVSRSRDSADCEPYVALGLKEDGEAPCEITIFLTLAQAEALQAALTAAMKEAKP